MIRFFAAHPTAANLLMLLFVAMGVLSLPRLKRETFPEIPAREIEVRVIYPGATPADVEDAVCRRIEDAIDGVSDIEEVRSEALEGLGRVTVVVREGASVDRVLQDVQTEIDGLTDLPDEAEDPVVEPIGRTEQVASIAVMGDMPVPHLKAYCEQLKERLQRRPEISLVEVLGFSDHQLRIEVPRDALLRHGLGMEDIARAVEDQSVDMPSGTLETRAQDVVVRFTDERRTVAALEDLVVIGGRSGAEIRIGDIAKVTDEFERAEAKVMFDGRRAGLLRVSKTRSEDSLVVVDAVKAFLDEERERTPTGADLELTQDLSSVVRDRLDMLVTNGWQGLLLVFFAMWLFFNFRLSFWVAVGLPVSFLGAFFFMTAIGYSINMMTMVALLLALGLLMDDSIVLAENIATHLARGEPSLRAAIDGTREVGIGVLSSFATTASVFGPMMFMAGDMGAVLGVLPVVLLLVLAVSLVEAFLILPAHLAHALRDEGSTRIGSMRRRVDAALDLARERVLGRAVDWFVRWRYLGFGLVVMVFFAALATVAFGIVKFQAFPDTDGDVVQARVLLPQGTPLARTEEVVARLRSALARTDASFRPRQPGGQALVQHVSVQYDVNADAHESGPHVATLSADLLGVDARDAAIRDVLGRWRAETGEVPDVVSLKFAEPGVGPAGLPIEVRLLGDDLEDLAEASREVRTWLASFEGVFDLADDLRPGKPEVRVRLREGAAALGVSARTIAGQLRASLIGRTVSEVQVGPERYEVQVRLAARDRDSLSDLEGFRVTLPGGTQVPIGTVARLEPDRGWSRIGRIDGRRAVTVTGDTDPERANVNELMGLLERDVLPGLRERHPGVSVSIEGEVAGGQETGGSLARAFLVGLIGIFIVLSFQFRSYVEPLVVMVAIPLCLIGVIWGHALLGLDLTMPSMVGFVSLAGVVVNDSILLVEFIKGRLAEGDPIVSAATRASRLRFRAVLLTSLTTIVGMVPLLTETSPQAQVLIPLAASIVFGLSASTLLVLIVIPALYTILFDLGVTAPVGEGADESHSRSAPREGATDGERVGSGATG